MRSRDEEFDAFVRASAPRLLHAAFALTGDRGRAEDLAQTALERTYLKWGNDIADPYAYARRVLVNATRDWWRRKSWVEQPVAEVPDRGISSDSSLAHAERDEVLRALGQLSTNERAVLVLRYYEDMSEQDTADTLRMPLGTVKTTTRRALAKLREPGVLAVNEVEHS